MGNGLLAVTGHGCSWHFEDQRRVLRPRRMTGLRKLKAARANLVGTQSSSGTPARSDVVRCRRVTTSRCVRCWLCSRLDNYHWWGAAPFTRRKVPVVLAAFVLAVIVGACLAAVIKGEGAVHEFLRAVF